MADERFEREFERAITKYVPEPTAGARRIGKELFEAGIQSHREAVGKRLREFAEANYESGVRRELCALADEFDPPVVAEEGKP